MAPKRKFGLFHNKGSLDPIDTERQRVIQRTRMEFAMATNLGRRQELYIRLFRRAPDAATAMLLANGFNGRQAHEFHISCGLPALRRGWM